MGRAPAEGFALDPSVEPSLQAFFTTASQVEAQSALAFRQLSAQLAHWDAPKRLLAQCERARRDELRHARLMAAQNRRPQSPLTKATRKPRRAPSPQGFPSLEALCLHNEREGVVGESWGALLAFYQAQHAQDPKLRSAMAQIAQDEARHAALSLALSRWARKKLGPDFSAQLDRVRAQSFDELRRTGGWQPDERLWPALGWAQPDVARAMLGQLTQALCTEPAATA